MGKKMQELKRHALRIASYQLEDAEFCEVYEDEDLEDFSHEDHKEIFRILTRETVAITSDEYQSLLEDHVEMSRIYAERDENFL